VLLLQVPIADTNSQWAPLGGVWATSLDASFSWLDPSYITGWTDTGSTSVGSVRVGSAFLEKYTSRLTLDSVSTGYYFDEATDILYIKLNQNRSPYLYDIYIGFPIFIGSSLYVDDVNLTEYQPRLLSAPKIKRRKDPITFGNLRFDSQSFTLANHDGFFDDLINEDIYGQPVSLYTGEQTEAFADFKKIYQGKLGGWSISADEVKLSTQDERRRLERDLPVNTWADLAFSFDGANGYAQLVYGYVRNLKIPHTGSGVFAIADTTEHNLKTQAEADITVTAENAAGGRVAVPSGALTLDESAGTVTITGYAEDGSSTYTGDVFFTGYGYDISNPLDIIKDLIVTYSDIAYTADNFNLTEWAAETTQAPDIGLVIRDKSKITKIIQEIVASYVGGFLTDKEGRFTSRRFATGNDTQTLIDRYQWYERIKLSGDTEQIYTSVDVAYNRDLEGNSYEHVIDTSKEADTYQRYSLYRDKSIKSLVVEETDAEAVASRFIDQYSDMNILAEGTIRLTDDILDLEQGQNVLVDLRDYRNRGYVQSQGWQRCEVLDIAIDPLNLSASVKLRLFQGVEEDNGDLCPAGITSVETEVTEETGELCVLGDYLGLEIIAERIGQGIGSAVAVGAGILPDLTNGLLCNSIY